MGDLQVIGGLRDKRSELIELVGCLEQQLADHRVSLTHLDATMRLFDPDLLLADTDLQQRERVSWFQPVRAIGQVVVGDDQVGHAMRNQVQSGRAVRRRHDVMALAGQQLPEHRSHVRIVFHDQDP
jgi:hypothetical protein